MRRHFPAFAYFDLGVVDIREHLPEVPHVDLGPQMAELGGIVRSPSQLCGPTDRPADDGSDNLGESPLRQLAFFGD
jgi:hypothetical protein